MGYPNECGDMNDALPHATIYCDRCEKEFETTGEWSGDGHHNPKEFEPDETLCPSCEEKGEEGQAVKEAEEQEIKHPDLEWAKQVVRDAKGDRVTEAELNTLLWNHSTGCYMMGWRGMVLGIETDKHIHS